MLDKVSSKSIKFNLFKLIPEQQKNGNLQKNAGKCQLCSQDSVKQTYLF